MIDRELLRVGAEKMGIVLDEIALNRFDRYAELLVEWNEKMNLTAITEPTAIVIRHFLDSLSALTMLDLPPHATIIDVGTGAGFPGIPLKIARPDLRLTLLDSLNKRITFLDAVSEALDLPFETVHARAEEGGRNPKLRERFDVATARAVAALPVLCEYCLPFVKVHGVFLAMKGPDCGEELAAAKNAIATLSSKPVRQLTQTLDDGSGRTLILVQKNAPIPAAYPRPSAKIAKAPLGVPTAK